MTEVEIREREGSQPKLLTKAVYHLIPDLYVISVEEASPWARSDKRNWSNEVRSSRVPQVGRASEFRMRQWPAVPVGPRGKKGEYCHETEHRQQCLKCEQYVQQRSETYKRQRKRTGTKKVGQKGLFADRLLVIDTMARLSQRAAAMTTGTNSLVAMFTDNQVGGHCNWNKP